MGPVHDWLTTLGLEVGAPVLLMPQGALSMLHCMPHGVP